MVMKIKSIKWEQFVEMRLREGCKVSYIVDELASITAQSPTTVWNWKAGKHKPTEAAQRLLDIWWHLPEEARKAFYP